jgi:hypothetical protein
MPLPNARVELYDSAGTFVGAAQTDASGVYTFTVEAGKTYLVRAVSASIGDVDTPPKGGFNSGFSGALPEQTFENNGVAANGWAGALGGNTLRVSDADTAAGAGAGDTNTTVVVTGDMHGVDFGFSYNLITNTKDSGQGSFRQFLINANASAVENLSLFQIPYHLAGLPDDPGVVNGIAVIQPQSSLPAVSGAVTYIDGSTQSTLVGNTNPGVPAVRIDGAQPGAGSVGLRVTGSGISVRSIDIRNFATAGGAAILFDGGKYNDMRFTLITNNGDAQAPNSSAIVLKDTANIFIYNSTITANNHDGVQFVGTSHDIMLLANTITNNGHDGVLLRGMTITLEKNMIAQNGGNGVTAIAASVTTLTQNAMSTNQGLGIDLDQNGVTPNDGTLNAMQANNGMDRPVITAANLNGSTLTITGYVGSAPGQAAFGSAHIEFFVSDGDPTGYGEGQYFISDLFADANGNFSGSIEVNAAALGRALTATATDQSGNTSEFGQNCLIVVQ